MKTIFHLMLFSFTYFPLIAQSCPDLEGEYYCNTTYGIRFMKILQTNHLYTIKHDGVWGRRETFLLNADGKLRYLSENSGTSVTFCNQNSLYEQTDFWLSADWQGVFHFRERLRSLSLDGESNLHIDELNVYDREYPIRDVTTVCTKNIVN